MTERFVRLLFLLVILGTFVGCQNPGRFHTASTWLDRR
jgi:hypothetical protein